MISHDLLDTLKTIEPDIVTVNQLWQDSNYENKFKNLEEITQRADFWEKPNQKNISRELQRITDLRSRYLYIINSYNDIKELITLFASDRKELKSIEKDTTKLQKEINTFKVNLSLQEPHDNAKKPLANYYIENELDRTPRLVPFSLGTLTENELSKYIYAYIRQNLKNTFCDVSESGEVCHYFENIINAQLKTIDYCYVTLLDCAAGIGSIHLIDVLLAHGADLNSTSALMWAIDKKQIDAALYLICLGISVEGTTGGEGNVLHLACRKGLVPVIKKLLNTHKNLAYKQATPFDLFNEDGYTTFHVAIIDEDIEFAQLLVEHGSPIDTTIRADDICNCFYDPNSSWHVEINLSPLHVAALYGKTKSVEYLLKLGAVDTPTKQKLTALHIAVHYGHEDIVRLLLAQKNNLLSVHYRERSAYDYATSCSVDDQKGTTNLNIIHLLRQQGA